MGRSCISGGYPDCLGFCIRRGVYAGSGIGSKVQTSTPLLAMLQPLRYKIHRYCQLTVVFAFDCRGGVGYYTLCGQRTISNATSVQPVTNALFGSSASDVIRICS